MASSEQNPAGTPLSPSLTYPPEAIILASLLTIALRLCEVLRRGIRLHGNAEVLQHLRAIRLQGGPWEAGSFSLLEAGWAGLSFLSVSRACGTVLSLGRGPSLGPGSGPVLSVSHSRVGSGRL